MAQNSYLWDGTAVGDAVNAPYGRQTFNKWLTHFFSIHTSSGVVHGLNTTELTLLSINISSGLAIVNNSIYKNTGDIVKNIGLPASGSYYYTVVLRRSTASKTIRIEVLGPDTTGYPTPVQSGDYYEIEIAQVWVKPTGIYHIFPYRRKIKSRAYPVLDFTARVGGDATNWNTGGSTAYVTPTYGVVMQMGVYVWSGYGTGFDTVVTFPLTFDGTPVVFFFPDQEGTREASATNVTTAQFTARTRFASAKTFVNGLWIAIGPLSGIP